jgi:hypothetical protein
MMPPLPLKQRQNSDPSGRMAFRIYNSDIKHNNSFFDNHQRNSYSRVSGLSVGSVDKINRPNMIFCSAFFRWFP